ncbi:MAG: hypothetical protein IPM32_04130 [Ignavibacteriae bacterium]|nr:hypothetical protein [Ignavibacteriota bacterium]
MKKIIGISTALFLKIPISLLAHEGHVHTGTFWETALHYIITKSWVIVIVIAGAYFLLRKKAIFQKEKN